MNADDLNRAAREAEALLNNPVYRQVFPEAREDIVRRIENSDEADEDLCGELRALKRVRDAITGRITLAQSHQSNLKSGRSVT
jgi:hypothetical protein